MAALVDNQKTVSQSQMVQMTASIVNEGRDRAEEITTKALQEFTVEKQKIVVQKQDKIKKDYKHKVKQVEMQQAIARCMAVNKSRLDKIAKRAEVVNRIEDMVKARFVEDTNGIGVGKEFMTKLIVQGLLTLMEENVMVRCRECDDDLVKSCFADAERGYTEVVARDSGVTRQVTLSLDTENKLPPATGSVNTCLGGVILACHNGHITIDNTIDSRLHLIMNQGKPVLRKLLFNS